VLSILLPAYDTDVRDIIRDLHTQAQSLSIDYEIICLDDDPQSLAWETNQELTTMGNVLLQRNTSNLGRAGNRNRLAQLARYSSLLYIDADSSIIHSNYLSTYVQAAQNSQWVYGGTSYPENCPEGCILHWSYGKQIEARGIAQRSGAGDFRSNNFLVHRDLMLAHPMDESLNRYGHEDTLWAHHMDSAGVPIRHVDNPVLHHGVYPDQIYLDRVAEASSHLAELTQRGILPRITRLQRTDHRFDIPVVRQIVDSYLRTRAQYFKSSLLSSFEQMDSRATKKQLSTLNWYKWSIYAASMRS